MFPADLQQCKDMMPPRGDDHVTQIKESTVWQPLAKE